MMDGPTRKWEREGGRGFPHYRLIVIIKKTLMTKLMFLLYYMVGQTNDISSYILTEVMLCVIKLNQS